MLTGQREGTRDLAVTLVTLLLVLAWDASGLDLAVTQAVASGHGFPWRDAWLTRTVLHEGGRLLAAFGVLGLLLHALWSRSARPRPR
jgi:membrane-associated PAP2 superfamily phosphatase